MNFPGKFATRAALAILSAGLAAGCKNPEPEKSRWIVFRGETMGTYYTVECLVPPGSGEKALHAGIRARLDEVNRELSNWEPESWVSRFNKLGPGKKIGCPPHALGVLGLSLELSRRTDGALDPTVSPLVELWGFGVSPARPEPPDETEIRETLGRCGYRHLDFDPAANTLSKRVDGIELNFSAVAKGYAVDLIAQTLEESGVENHLVNIGGEIRAGGNRSDGTPWTVGIADPLAEGAPLAGRIQLSQNAAATSGDSHRFLDREGRRDSHLIDPRTGVPANNRLRSVTVTAPTCALADGLATACFILGPDEGMELIESFPQAEGLFLLSDADSLTTKSSSGWGE